MTTLREAAQQALAAMEAADVDPHSSDAVYKAIEALRAALEEPQSTHSADCYQWHHKCAIAEVERLRVALAEPVQEPNIERSTYDSMTATLARVAIAKAEEKV